MAQSTRVPAWKRLGLKLQKDQSQEQHVPQTDDFHHVHVDNSGEPRMALDHALDSAPSPIQTTKSKLGKRKHQDGPAELQEKSIKKSRNEKPHHKTAQQVQTPNATTRESPAPTSAPASALKSHLKGDPNYRKKKEKASKKNKWDAQASQPSPSIEKATKHLLESQPKLKTVKPILRTPSLSPGRLDPSDALLASTETDFPTSPPKRSHPSSSPPAVRTDRRKSVTFTPDTKTVDGNSAQNLFKKWVQEQKSTEEFTDAEISQFEPPPKVHPANSLLAPTPAATSKDAKKTRKAKTDPNAESERINPTGEIKKALSDTSGTKTKKDPSRYLDYLTQYHTDRPNWKFNKAKQNDVLSNALNVFRIPEEYSDALLAYVSGLQGAGVIERLRQQCITTIQEIDALGTTDAEDKFTMDDPQTRQAAQDQAMKEHTAKQRRRRRTEADMEDFAKHPYPEAFVRRMKRGRAEALQKALGYALPAPSPVVVDNKRQAPDRKGPKAKKRRTEVDISSDESTDSSNSEESSSEEDSSEESSSEEESSDDESDSESGESADESSSDKYGSKKSESDGSSSSSSSSDSDSDSD